jgi:hypothetical protein
MLIKFLNHLYKKPIEYQLFWIYVLGQIDDGNTSVIQLKKLKSTFNYNKHTFYRILRFGLKFFNAKNNGVCIELTNSNLIIKVVRNKNVNIEKNNEKSLKSINEKTMKVVDENTVKLVNEKIIEKPLKSINKKTIKSNNDLIKIVIDYLNEKTSKKFTTKNKQMFEIESFYLLKKQRLDWSVCGSGRPQSVRSQERLGCFGARGGNTNKTGVCRAGRAQAARSQECLGCFCVRETNNNKQTKDCRAARVT